MKWFKHDSDARDDTKIKLLKRKFGAEGYGVYFQLVEIIAQHIEKDNVTDWGYVEKVHTTETLAEEVGVTPDKLRTILQFCDDLGLFEKKNDRLYCHKILKRMDEYFQKLDAKYRKNPDLIPTNSGYRTEQNRTEEEQNRTEKNRTGFASPNGSAGYSHLSVKEQLAIAKKIEEEE